MTIEENGEIVAFDEKGVVSIGGVSRPSKMGFVPVSGMRFIIRDGEKVLQEMLLTEWYDVPVIDLDGK